MADRRKACRSSTPGLLFYTPQSWDRNSAKPIPLFRPRRLGPGRIRIRPIVDTELETTAAAAKDPFLSTRKRLWRAKFKLAISREPAKRFLRSVIAPPSHSSALDNQNSSNNSSGENRQRRSWSPVKRTRTGDSAAAGEAGNMRGADIRGSIGAPVNPHLHRPRLSSDARHASVQSETSSLSGSRPSPRVEAVTVDSSAIPSTDLDEKPIASGNGVSMSVHLAEPVLFLQGFDQGEHAAPGNTAMLRGSLHLRVQKSAKIKGVKLEFKGTALTKWPEGIPPRKTEFEERDTIMRHTWPFFDAKFETAEKTTNADHVQLFKTDGASTSVTRLDPLGRSSPNASSTNLTPKEARKLALSVNQSRSFEKGTPPSGGPGVVARGYRTFLPGDYVYNFELPLDSRLPETIDVELGSVRYELEATVERSGAFRSNLVGHKEIILIRAPAEGSLEQVEPIAISRNWEDQLHYDIVISGKSFPLGTQVPVAFKLTPLAKVQCHRIKVLVTENIEYFCAQKRVHRMEPTRKVQLFEKRSDGPPISAFPGSTMRVISGGGIPYDARARAARGEDVTPLDSSNMLGDLEGDTNIGPTEMEFNVQLPSCQAMTERAREQRLHFDTTYQNIQVHHWIKIVMRLSKPDAVDPTKRRHFEISIDSPFHILSCRATQANISLPAYSSPAENLSSNSDSSLYDCGCPGAAHHRRRNSPQNSFAPPALSALNTSDSDLQRPGTATTQSPGLARPPQAHVHGPQQHQQNQQESQQQQWHHPTQQHQARPMHMLRAPSFDPPAFEDDEAPPPHPLTLRLVAETPPPLYGDIASPTSGLADYFSRLSDAYDDDDGDGEGSLHRAGRVNLPLTPGGRMNRSMDLRRPWGAVGAVEQSSGVEAGR